MKRPALSIALALAATLVMTVTAAASNTYTEWIHGSELPNATPTEGQFVGEATGSFAGAWYIDVTHQVLQNNQTPVAITGGRFRLNTVINGWPDEILGSFTPWHGSVRQLDGFSGCTNQHYAVQGQLIERECESELDALRHDPASAIRGVDPVTELCTLPRSAYDRRQRDPADDGLSRLAKEGDEHVRGSRFPVAALLGDRPAELGEPERIGPGRRRWTPRAKVVCVSAQDRSELRDVDRARRTKNQPARFEPRLERYRHALLPHGIYQRDATPTKAPR